MKNVLLISHRNESYYFEPFVAACERKGIQMLVLDPSLFPQHATLSITVDQHGGRHGSIDVLTWGTSSVYKATVAAADISAAWSLRDSVVRDTDDSSVEARFRGSETDAALKMFLSILPCPWVNRKQDVSFLTSNKLYQQVVAAECGLTVPLTLVSNDPSAVTAFSDSARWLLLKSMGYVRLDNAGRYFLYSERFSHEELTTEQDAIRACPIFAQEYVEKRYEYRVMAIGNRILSCRIDSQASEQTKVDWRHYDLENVAHIQVDLPRHVNEKILHFMQRVNLQYGAIDLIETPEGDFVFLEINPSGQWGWIADLAGLPIADAVADMLDELIHLRASGSDQSRSERVASSC